MWVFHIQCVFIIQQRACGHRIKRNIFATTQLRAQPATNVFLYFSCTTEALKLFPVRACVHTRQCLSLFTTHYKMCTAAIESWLRLETNRAPHRCKKIIRQWTAEDGIHITCRTDQGLLQTHYLFTMSSLSRRACYKCGNVGHYAEVCSSAERLCYNCKLFLNSGTTRIKLILFQANSPVRTAFV